MGKISELKNAARQQMLKGTAEAVTVVETKIKPKIESALQKKSVRIGTGAALALTTLAGFPCAVFADPVANPGDIQTKIDTAGAQILSFLQGILLTIGAVSLAVCGIVLLFGLGGQRASENAKSWAFRIFIGMAIVLLAKPIIQWIYNLMSGSATP